MMDLRDLSATKAFSAHLTYFLLPYPWAIRLRVGEVPREEKMLLRETDPETCITEYTVVCEENLPTLCRPAVF